MQWESLVKVALLGSERQSLTIPTTSGDPLDEALARLDTTDAEGALLGAAAICAAYREAGRRPATSVAPLPAACPPDNLPECSPHAAGHLETMLNEPQRADVLPEWLRLLHKRGQHVPARHLPALLDRGHKQKDVQQDILPVLGQRGYWLAARNSDWNYVHRGTIQDAHAEEIWQTGNLDARLALLQQLRADDPARARALLETTWTQDAAKERANFLQWLRQNLSMEDEPFLEAALDDRSKEVRRLAADMLARLPDSRLVQRMIERVQPLLTFHSGDLLKQVHLEVTLPEECTKEMQRDGVEPKPPQKAQGEKGWWLQQMLAVVPPTFWCERWETTLQALIQAANKTEWQNLFQEGWAAAASRHGDVAWAEALLKAYPGLNDELIGVLPPADREARMLHMLTQGSLDNAAALLQHCASPWSIELSRAVVQAIRRPLTGTSDKQRKQGTQMYQLLVFVPYRLAPAIADEAAAAWTKAEGEQWSISEYYLQEMLAILQFRNEMHEALNAK